jgi:peptidyl-tRNA hydrolase, PTH1 family
MKIKLIIGIGNPDEQYKETRHNVGFMMVDYVAKKNDPVKADGPRSFTGFGNFEFNKKLNTLTAKGKVNGSSIVFAKPQTYVNKTGEAAVKLKNFYKVKSEQILVIQDDLDIPFGNTKISFDKNSGGHKGIESIMKALKTKKFYRLRIGLANQALQKARQRFYGGLKHRHKKLLRDQQSDKKRDEFVVKMVLSKFSPSEQEEIKKIFKEGYEKLLQIK